MRRQRQIDVLSAQKALAEAQFVRADTLKHQAALNLSYATIRAPVDGTVGTAQRLQQLAQVGLVQARAQRYADTVKLFLASGARGRADLGKLLDRDVLIPDLAGERTPSLPSD